MSKQQVQWRVTKMAGGGWLEHVPCENGLRTLGFSLDRRRLWGVLIPIFQNL